MTAWSKAHAVHPDPVKTYSEAIKAVEAAAAHAVTGAQQWRRDLAVDEDPDSGPEQFRLVLAAGTGDVRVVVSMMDALWDGQTSRHGGQAEMRPEVLQEAQAAVHLAVTLVQWFTSGVVQRA